jgi:hypothetical protein
MNQVHYCPQSLHAHIQQLKSRKKQLFPHFQVCQPITHLKDYLEDPSSPEIPLYMMMVALSDNEQAVVDAQTLIGWKYILSGCLSLELTHIQDQ